MRMALAVTLVLLFGLFGCPGTTGEGEFLPNGTDSINGSGYSVEEGNETGAAPETGEEGEEGPITPPQEPGEPKEMLEAFILEKMMDENGVVRNEFANGRPYMLAETAGQMMEYALLIGDRELFDLQFTLLEEYFINGEYGVAHSSIWADDYVPRENISNTDDNMRFAWALWKAEEKWGSRRYGEIRELIADSMVEYNAYLNILSKGVSWDGSGHKTSGRMDVDDLRWEVMQQLATENPIWRVMLEKTTPLFLECQSEGLFWQEYDIIDSRPLYPEGKDVSSTAHMLRAAMYFSDYNTYVPANALNVRMKNEWASKGRISSAYYMEHGGIGNNEETMETYALAARNAIRLGDCDFAIKMRQRILEEQVDDLESDIYGSVSRNRQENGIEDDLDTLLMLLELEGCE
jgi:endo-1,4-beta-D-glucanase Y